MNTRRREREQRDRPLLQQSKLNKREKIIDLTGIKPVKRRNTVRSGLGDTSTSNNRSSSNNDIVFFTVSDHKGLEEPEDEYAKYDQMFDGFADQQLINSGATIIKSEIEITDSQGRNRKLVRRNDNERPSYY